MIYYLVKLLLSAVVIVVVSELSKRSTTLGALLASLPLVSILAMIWLHIETGDNAKIAELAGGIFWLELLGQPRDRVGGHSSVVCGGILVASAVRVWIFRPRNRQQDEQILGHSFD